MFVELTGAAANFAWEHRDNLIETVKKLVKLLSNGYINVVVFGSGGVGKTTLGHLLSGSLDPDAKHLDYIESENTESMPLKAKLYGSLLVAAGQERRRDVSWPALFQKMSAGKVVGVINVVAWGCHSVEGLADYKEHRVYKEWKAANPHSEMSVERFVEAFQAEMLREELEALKYIQPHLEAAQGKVWMITIVSKQDLWWDKRHEVRRFYEGGEYERIIAAIRTRRGTGHFNHEYVSASIKWENLRTAKEVLIPTVSGYDDAIRTANLAKLSQAVRQLVENADT